MGVCDSPNRNEVLTKNPLIKLPSFIANISKSLCKIEYENQIATGFLIKLFKNRKEFFCLMTCEHVVTRAMIKQRKTISFYYDSSDVKMQIIELDPDKRFIQDFVSLSKIDNNIDINIDATVIEILPEDDIPKAFFLSSNENHINNYDALKNKEIAIIQYPEGNLEYSFGEIKNIDRYEIIHTASTKHGSSGSPIILVNTNKVVGIHKGGDKKKYENYGYCIGPIYNFFKNFCDEKKIMNNNMYRPNIIIDYIPINKKPDNKLNKMTILYKIKQIKRDYIYYYIFGKTFVENNKNNCYLLINGKERELCCFLDYNDEFSVINGILKIILIEKNPITDMSYMFDNHLNDIIKTIQISSPDISDWDTTNVANLSNLFYDCDFLKSLPDISNWNTVNVTDMTCLFNKCSSLKSLPDISKWNIVNVKKLNLLFNECELLFSLPDISKWKTNNIDDIGYMFHRCNSLISLPDISNWKTDKVTLMWHLFKKCSSLITMPDISKWNTSNVYSMENMFCGCSSLISLPDIAKWNTSNIKDVTKMFEGCLSLPYIPDISFWKHATISDNSDIFNECLTAINLPDRSSWPLKKRTKVFIFSAMK